MKILNLCGKSVVSIAVLAMFGGAVAAENARRSMMNEPSRMPTIPVATMNTIGNPAVGTMTAPVNNTTYLPTINPSITPDVQPEPEPDPEERCQDGTVKNSKYTVAMCMDDMLRCVNTGALQGGLNDLYNEDVRNSIMNGMRLCQVAVDKCISDVRINCHNVYNETTDVWLDFNSRVVQPEYYNFVLRKTGLTPNQAENTCLLLDRNTYGVSFAAVSDTDEVNTEYNNKVGAYNRAENGMLSKDRPQGVAVNTVGYDGNRGHYARWDAVNGECLIRVGAYNKDKAITNSWLFGAVGNNNAAEVWQKAGSTFTCDKNLFGFSLLNDTKTAAVVGVGGGTVLGAAIGAAAGAGAYEAKKKAAETHPCLDATYRANLMAEIRKSRRGPIINLFYDGVYSDGAGSLSSSGASIFPQDATYWEEMTIDQCKAIHYAFDRITLYDFAFKECKQLGAEELFAAIKASAPDATCISEVRDGKAILLDAQGVECGSFEITESYTVAQIETIASKCSFVPLLIGLDDPDNEHSPYCTREGVGCIPLPEAQRQRNLLNSELSHIKNAVKFYDESDLNKGAEIGKGVGIGAAVGAGAGGLATAITAFVERGNVTCHVGDGLNVVALGKSHTIDSLKDFYVKWNLHLPDTVSPTSAVTDLNSWNQGCMQFNNKLNECAKVQVNYKSGGKYELIQGACKVSGSMCVVNEVVAESHGIK